MTTPDARPDAAPLDLTGLSLRDLDTLEGTVLAEALGRALTTDSADISGFSSYVGPGPVADNSG